MFDKFCETVHQFSISVDIRALDIEAFIVPVANDELLHFVTAVMEEPEHLFEVFGFFKV